MRKSLCVFCLLALLTIHVQAATLLLRGGGILEGEILNPHDVPRSSYEVRTSSGIRIKVASTQIDRPKPKEREAFGAYALFAPLRENTVEQQMEVVEWCREKRLPEQMRLHLNRVVRLEPDHLLARRLLGQHKVDGFWTTKEELNKSQGFQMYKGSWRTRQEIEIDALIEQGKKQELQWKRDLEKTRASLGHNPSARETITRIKESAAARPLTEMLRAEASADVRLLYVQALSNIGSPLAVRTLAEWAISEKENVREVRLQCFEEIRKHPIAIPSLAGYYASLLESSDNTTINRAAWALGEIGARSAVPRLIDVLVTEHTRRIQINAAGNVNMASGAFAWGQSERKESKTVSNQDVRNALIKLTDGVDHGYDQERWKNWLIRNNKTPDFDPRRG